MNYLKKRTISGIIWSFYGQIVIQGINFLTWIILARSLTPEDFGLVAMVLVFSRFLQIFKNMGLIEALIQSKRVDETTLSTVFWFQLLIALIIGAGFFFSSSIIEDFYKEPILYDIVGFIALEYFLGAVVLVPMAVMQKHLAFKKLFLLKFMSVIISSVLAIYLAWQEFGYWSLIFRLISLTGLTGVLALLFSNWTPILCFRYKKLVLLFHVSLPLLWTQIINYLVRNIDDILIGKFFGKQSLGVYNRSYAFMLFPIAQITRSVSKVLFPVFSIIQDDLESVRRVYLKSSRFVALISFPLMIGLWILSDEIVFILLGPQWKDMIPLLKILIIVGMFQSLSALNGSVFISLNATALQLKLNLVSGIVMILSIFFGIFVLQNVEGVAICYTIASFCMAFPIWFNLSKLLKSNLSEILINIFPAFICALGMGVLLFILEYLKYWEFNIFHLTLKCVLGITFYIVLVYIFNWKVIVEIKSVLKEFYYGKATKN